MKKTRVLAALLCVMMLVCAIPVMQVSAASVKDADLMEAIGKVMGYGYAVPAQNNVNWAVANMDFSNSFVQPDTITADDGITYNENGIVFPAGSAEDAGKNWSYFEVVNENIYNNNRGWSPLCAYAHYSFRFKLDEGGSLENYATRTWGTDNTGVDFTATPEKVEFLSNGNVVHNPDKSPVSYVPGTEWNDVLVKHIINADGSVNIRLGYEIWMKKASESEFTMLGAGASFTPSAQWATDGLKFVGKGANVKHVATAMPYTGTYFNSMEEFAGNTLIEDVAISFDGSFVKDENMNEPAGMTYSDENGAWLPTGAVDWKGAWFYNPGKPINANVYTPLKDGVAYLKAMVPTDGYLIIQMNKADADTGRVYIEVTPSKITLSCASGAVTGSFVPGTDWVEYIIRDNAGNYEMYAKREGNKEKWFLVGTSNGYRPGKTHGYNLVGASTSGAYVKEVKVFADTSKFAATIDDVVGGPVATTYNFELNESYNQNLSYQEGEVVYGINQTGEYTADGWKGTKWSFLPKDEWMPLENAGDVTAAYFQAKIPEGTTEPLNVQGHTGSGRIYMNIFADKMAYSNTSTRTIEHALSPGNDWAEYLITQHNNGAGYALYMKSETVTANKWVRLLYTMDVDANSYIRRGLEFNSDGQALFKNVKIYSTFKSVGEASTKPATATSVLYEENFDAAPTYKNLAAVGTTYEDGNMVLTETYDQQAQVVIKNTGIPVGGYAEFRIKVGDTQPIIHFYDGEKDFAILNRISYGQIQSANSALLYSAEAGDTYRTWRVVHNANGSYSAYCKADGDTAWYAAQVSAQGKAVANIPQIKVLGSLGYDESSDGVTEVDYIKIYGPASETGVMTLSDGYGTKMLADGDVVTCPEEIRINVQKSAAEQTILVAETKSGILQNLTSIPVATGSDVFTASYDVVDETAKITVYLWDGSDKIASVTKQVNLTIEQ